MSIPFRPFQGTEELIGKQDRYPGHVYFATDSGKIFLDTETERITVGGGGVAVLYASAEEVKKDLTDFSYILYQTNLDNREATPKKDDLIINLDGRFFKVLSYNKDSGIIKCSLLAVSGTGGGGGGGDNPSGPVVSNMELLCTGTVPNAQVYIYGQIQNVEFTPNAKLDAVVTISYTITSSVDASQSQTYTYTVPSNKPHIFDLGSKLFRGANTLSVVAVGANSGTKNLDYLAINSITLDLKSSDNFNPLNYAYNSNLTFYCMPVGAVDKTLRVYLNNDLAAEKKYNSTISEQSQGIELDKRDHGVYELKAVLAYSLGITEVLTDPLRYEVAFVDPANSAPLIWFKDYPRTIVDHDKLTLEFMVYDPASPAETDVRRYINGEEITELEDIAYSAQKWHTWNISNYKLGKNTFALQCGTTTREITIYVDEDTVRNLDIVSAGLHLNLDTLDRSNKENKTSREKWEYVHGDGSKTAVRFNNFNWYNNGWLDDDETKNSILRISNGASIDIPLDLMTTTKLGHSLTMELRFRLRNVQKYENLIEITSEVIGTNEFGEDIVKVNKTVSSTDGVWGKYFGNNIGMCLGTQEGFFKGSAAIASGRYKEDQIVTVSFVVEEMTATNPYPLIYMYIDGVMCSIIEYDKTNESFKSDAAFININSDYCDVDLLNVRVYKAALSSSEIVQNYLADQNDAVLYDMNQIVVFKNNIPTIDYTTMVTYNANHPDQLLYPYAVLECVDKTEDKLPYVKDGKKMVNVTFVNPALDKAYKDKLITDEDYLCGAPSFYAENIEFDVQGTSSQGYPRRNFKGKFKKKDNNSWVYTDGPLKGKEIGETNEHNGHEYKGFYMDNTYSETTFTWKADYMESSMTHNTGFASFVNTLYNHHPLEDYDDNIDVTNRRTTVYGFPMMVFQKTAKTNDKGEPIYEFVGRYNFNLDKGCNNVIGFEDKHAHPYVAGKTFKNVAECWELKHNQGGRVAFTKANFAETDSSGKLTVLGDFEHRYHAEKDDIENAIDGLENWESKSQSERNAYLLEKYRNLEKVTEWLVATDTTPVSGEGYVAPKLPAPVTYGEGEFAVTYEYDTRDYRIAKFKNEFTKHFNTHYCAIYFIMTEFLIQYDSRGKNMMIATWGPQEENGEYIWYPIFYDIDTQLGVNNSGVPSWEYYDEPTKQGDFSTSGSVLWNNFYECFYDTIVSTYVTLRKNGLTYEKLNGYYSYDPNYILYTGFDGKNHNSFVMRGHRPINVINVDQYYKYIAPTFSGYINTSGTISKDEGKRFYCLQGNRDLHRELFLRNRFNFQDSAWLGGTYNIEAAKQEFQIRTNANKYVPDGLNNTSDRFLAREPSAAEISSGFSQNANHPLNSDWTWDIVPYLRQYVSVYYDEILQRDPIEYNGDGNSIAVRYREDNEKEVRETPNFGQQLTYIGGSEYISSLGDISLKYPDEIYLTGLKRLRDIRLGNDEPGYLNNALTKCILGAGAVDTENKENPNAKRLLESVVLTGVGSLSQTIDITGSEKLKEFRALGTNIPGVTFANGVQLETVHLPNTVTYVELIEPVSLKNILTNPNPSGVDEKTGYNIYPEGLYIQGVTDSDKADLTLVNKYVITGGNMGYDSYRLLKNLVDIKQTMQNKPDLDTEKYSKNIAISLKEVNWTPYRLVAYGEEVDVTKAYKKITENSTLVDYTPGRDWSKDTLNQLVYEVNAELDAQKSVITDLSMLDLFLDEHRNLGPSTPNYYTDIVEYSDKRKTYPNITGNIFINNPASSPISEYEIKNFYNVKYPELKILVNAVTPAYTLKMVEINPDTKQEIVLETLKYEATGVLPVNKNDITVTPSRLHHDFIGWSLDGMNVLSDEDWAAMVFNSSNTIYTVFAMFSYTSYDATFIDRDTNYREITSASYGHNFSEPALLPHRGMQEDQLPLTTRLAFKGWTANADLSNYVVGAGELVDLLVDPTTYVAEKNYTFYALYTQENVYEVATDDKYFSFSQLADGTWMVSGNPIYQLSGKITVPATHKDADGNENQITQIGIFSNALQAKHIFFMDKSVYPNSTMPANFLTVNANAFYNAEGQNLQTSLEGVYLPDSIREIGRQAFFQTISIKHVSDHYSKLEEAGHMSDNLVSIGDSAFGGQLTVKGQFVLYKLPDGLTSIGQKAFYMGGDNIKFTSLPKNVAKIRTQTFAYLDNISIMDFGSDANENVSTPLIEIEAQAFPQLQGTTGVNKTVDRIRIRSSVAKVGTGAFKNYGINSGGFSDITVYVTDDTAEWIDNYSVIGFSKRPEKYIEQ
jgi:hypothetical protein